jgi:GT2 family glycosyltransferase
MKPPLFPDPTWIAEQCRDLFRTPVRAASGDVNISVLTLLRGRLEHLHNLVEGLRRSTRPPDELVVARMGGPDPSRVAALAPCPAHVLDIPSSPERLPLAEARNGAARAAVGDIFVFLDVDCIPGAQLVASYERALVDMDALIMGPVHYLPQGATDGEWDETALLSLGAEHPARQIRESGLSRTAEYELFWSLSFAVRRSTFDRIGGFDPRFTGYGGEDTDFAFAARRAGVSLFWLGDAPAYHQDHEQYDPPLHHLVEIVANARAFRDKWDVWPMQGWLSAFADAGYVEWTADDLVIANEPSAKQLAAVRRRAFPATTEGPSTERGAKP